MKSVSAPDDPGWRKKVRSQAKHDHELSGTSGPRREIIVKENESGDRHRQRWWWRSDLLKEDLLNCAYGGATPSRPSRKKSHAKTREPKA